MVRKAALLSGLMGFASILATPACGSAPPSAPATLPDSIPPRAAPESASPGPAVAAPEGPPDGCQYVGRVAAIAPPDPVPSLAPVYSPPETNPIASTCSPKACPYGLRVNLPHSGDWAPGRYHVEVDTEWGTTSCLATLGPSRPSLGPIVFSSSPSEVHLRIERGRRLLVERALSSKFTNRRHDGYQCPAVCRFAEENVPVP